MVARRRLTPTQSVSAYINSVAPELAPGYREYDPGRGDVFAAYRIDEQITKALERKVHLPSGGSLVIDRTEAMTVVDVNTGKFTGSGGNLEETVTKNNLEAAEEIVRQLRLRDIGGIIVVDFIDMVLESNRELVLRRLTECLGRDRTRHQVAEVTSLGLIQMTRKKMGTGLVEAFSEPCPHCGGRGILLHDMPTGAGRCQEDEEPERRSGRRRGKGQRDNRETPVEQPQGGRADRTAPGPAWSQGAWHFRTMTTMLPAGSPANDAGARWPRSGPHERPVDADRRGQRGPGGSRCAAGRRAAGRRNDSEQPPDRIERRRAGGIGRRATRPAAQQDDQTGDQPAPRRSSRKPSRKRPAADTEPAEPRGRRRGRRAAGPSGGCSGVWSSGATSGAGEVVAPTAAVAVATVDASRRRHRERSDADRPSRTVRRRRAATRPAGPATSG